MDFSSEVIIIFGASSDTGKTLTKILKSNGCTIIGTYHKNKIGILNDEIKCDVTNEKDVEKVYKYTLDKYSKISAVINMTTLSLDNDIKDKSYKEFMEVVSVNLGGTFLVDKYASIYMKHGTVINMSSLDASKSFRIDSADYAASKAGIENLTKNFAKGFPSLKYCALSPAWINTSSVLEMEPHYLEEEMKKFDQVELLRKEDVSLKIIEILINNDDYISGDIIEMEKNYE